jgi:WD40-like Beta Propeller Repeat
LECPLRHHPSSLPCWIPKGRERKNLYWVPADGAGPPELLAKAETIVVRPTSFSPDGHTLLFAKGTWNGPPRNVGVLLYAIGLDGDRTPRVFMDAPYPISFGAFSPDGNWIAFVSFESGGPGVYLRAADLKGPVWPLSKDTGMGPDWSGSGRELFFQDGSDLVSVPIVGASGPGDARVVIKHVFTEGGNSERSFELGRGRYLIWQPPREEGAAPQTSRVVVIPNWFDEVRARMRPARRQ